MRRRDFLASAFVVPGVAGAFPAAAQTARRARLGWLSGGSRDGWLSGGSRDAAAPDRTIAVLRLALHELGWRLGETLDIEERLARGEAASLPGLAAELVALRPDVIACTGGTEAKALQEATREIPIVFFQISADPVATGLVASISRPGGNVTGFTQGPQILSGKRLGILTELLGRPPRRLAYVLNPASANSGPMWTDAAEAAAKIGAEILRVPVGAAGELDAAFAGLKDRDAVLVSHDLMFFGLRRRFAELAVLHRLPVMYENEGHVAVGGLVSYGADLRENYRRGAAYIDRILKGARPGDLPVVQASRFELVVNTAAAKAIVSKSRPPSSPGPTR